MCKIKDEIEEQKNKNLINEELDYFYFKEKELMDNISDIMELRQDLINGIKDDLKKLSEIYKVKDEEEISYELCQNCGVPCEHLYCDKCDKEIDDYEFNRQDINN